MTAYKLLAHLNHLTLVGRNVFGFLVWTGTKNNWLDMEFEIRQFERERVFTRASDSLDERTDDGARFPLGRNF